MAMENAGAAMGIRVPRPMARCPRRRKNRCWPAIAPPATVRWPGVARRRARSTAGPENPSFHHRRGCCAPPAAGLEGRCRPIIPAPVLRLIYEDPTGKALRANAPEPQDCTNR
ncbi:hypothetical protein Veis_4846 [Verminephrobacter eiseniae EF01-2]|uniref:Uncharacterized protein n=1 Tax=Verminephrobacter eiseniae (strain EF01-2) TaxID=391735 RepID=A1WSD0_VEREI|nr:hypothetical protein Veis_4846 [Verminephrobacter eiseniae EF01-2]